MESVTVPFAAHYASSGLDATGLDSLVIGGGTTLVIGEMAARTEVRGLVRVTPEAVVIEYRPTRVQVVGVSATPGDTALRTVRIPMSAIDSIQLKAGLFRKPRLIFHFSRLDQVPDLPWSDTTRLVLLIDRLDRDRGRELVISTRMHLADAELRRLGE